MARLTPPEIDQASKWSPSSTEELAGSPLWRTRSDALTVTERVALSYRRAKSVVQHYQLRAEDVLRLSERYWQFHSDPILVMDGSVATLLTIHYNLCLGTLAMYFRDRPDLQPIVDKLVSFEWNGQYCLTELGHGLDVINMETTATLLPDGSFELHTPTESAAKFMPPTAPSGYPCVAIVHARLMVDGQDRGPKPFLTQIHDGREMSPGITSRVLAPCGLGRPVKHCLTYFDRVRLPASALLGSSSKPELPQEAFFHNIYRVITGTLSMGTLGVSGLRVASYIAATYSLRRRVLDSSTRVPRPIMHFSTQYTPVLSAVAQSLVLRLFSDHCHQLFTSTSDLPTKHLIAAVSKATILSATQTTLTELGNRCGAQGLAEVNQIAPLSMEVRGAAIAEGDVLAISIRFAIDVLRGKVEVPPCRDPTSLLAKRELSLTSSMQLALLVAVNHRDGSLATSVLPMCQTLIEAIGARIAFEAAAGRVPESVRDLFVASTIKRNGAWYASHEGLDDMAQVRMEAEAARALLPRVSELLDMLEVRPYITAPIVSDEMWSVYVSGLDKYVGQPFAISSKL